MPPTDKTLTLAFHGRVIDHLGIQMYQSPTAALAELVSNCWDADSEQAHITLPATMSQGAEIVVKDNGIGFDEKYSEKIFNIFQRLHGRMEYEGTGIGLAICRKIVLNHNGYITVSSKENEGSEFIVILPAS